MTVGTKEAIREEIAQSRRLLAQSTDPATVANLAASIEELEGQLLLSMTEGPD